MPLKGWAGTHTWAKREQNFKDCQGWTPPQSLREEGHQDRKAETPQPKRGKASRAEIKDAPQNPKVKTHAGQSQRPPQGQREEAPLGENRGAPQSRTEFSPKFQEKRSPQSPEMQMLPSWEGSISRAWEVAPGEATVQSPEEGGPRGHPRDSCGSLKAQTPKPVGRESPDLRRGTTKLMQGMSKGDAVAKLGAAREGAWAALPSPRLAARRRLPGLGAMMPATLRAKVSGQQGLPAALWGPPGLERHPHGLQGPGEGLGPGEQEVGSAWLPGALRGRGGCPEISKASKAEWPAPPSRPKAPAGVSAAQQEAALQRLLELHSAARRRRRRDSEQQRLRVRPRARIWACLGGRGTEGGGTLTAASTGPGMPPHRQEPPLPGSSPGAPAQRGSTPSTGKTPRKRPQGA
ncbi:hypothetical protein AAY473_010729 [Plecturocebus cupreus]